MAKFQTISCLTEAISHWVNSSELECFYSGVRYQCALDLGVAPNSALFHAAWELTDLYQTATQIRAALSS